MLEAIEPNPKSDSALEHNQEQVERLSRRIEELEAELLDRFILTTALHRFGPRFASMPSITRTLIQWQIAVRLRDAAIALIEAFTNRGVIISCEVAVPGETALDLFVRFPNQPKAIFLVGLRSNGQSKIFFREGKEGLYYQRKGSGLRPLRTNLFSQFGGQEYWLRQHRQDLFGPSLRDRKRAAIKVLALAEGTHIGHHRDELYVQVGNEKVLLAKTRISLYILQSSQLVGFVQGWLDGLG